ncbi:MAG: Calx-beta domain-containing protein, partial [Pyrinomonadaceae bacterium]
MTKFTKLTSRVRATSGVPISLSTPDTAYTQDFDTLADTGTSSALPIGWTLSETGTNADATYAAGTGSSTTGNTYSFGSTGSAERAFGGLQSGSLNPSFGACFINHMSVPITSLTINYIGEQWRLGTANRVDRIDFQYSLDATDLTTGTWIDVDSLDFSSPTTSSGSGAIGALDGNAAANRMNVSFTISGLNIPIGATFFVRWLDFNASGSDDGLSVDDFALTPNGSGPLLPSLSINDVTVMESNNSPTTAVFTISLSLPAGPNGVTYDISTQDNTATASNNDYVARSLVGEIIPEGEQTKTFDVTVNSDTLLEPNETFFINVTNVDGAIIADGQSVGTINNNNDGIPITPINQIQGSGTQSPLVGQNVRTTGIITGVKNNGFFIQTPDANVDIDPRTSEGVFVFMSSPSPATISIGNNVSVTGRVQEFRPNADPNSPPMTELAVLSVVLDSIGNPLPNPITLTAADTDPDGSIEQLERFEGMRVRVSSLTVVGPGGGFINEPNATVTSNGDFYGVIMGIARPQREAGIDILDPIPAPAPIPNNIPRFDTNPERLRIDSNGQTGAVILDVTAGTVLENVVGPLEYTFRTYTILPDVATPPTITRLATATPVPAATNRETTVASFNMERFFDNQNDPVTDDPVLTTTAFNNRLNKASLVIRNILRMPDVIGVEEMENLSTLQAVANKVNID